MPVDDSHPSATYKIKTPDHISEHAGYFTIVGEFEPESFFLNSKEMGAQQWVTALMTSYTHQMRAGVPIEDIIHAMKTSFSPDGSYFIPLVSKSDPDPLVRSLAGIEVHSIIHHLGLVLERHMEYIIETHEETEDGE